MNTLQYLQKTVVAFFIMGLLLFHNTAFSQNNGPTSPEATSFEPVDASDIVNLLTGDMTYTLPLLNVPSPEGGYPIALAYHAGIAMDQDATWVGLGWSLNPGALNRSVNGNPDDWSKTKINEFFYDKGWEEDHFNVTIGGTLPNGISIGLGGSWGSNKSFGGTVSFGYAGFRASFGSNGPSFGVRGKIGPLSAGFNSSGNLNIGLGSANLGYNVNSGFSGSYSMGGSISKNGLIGVSTGISFSSKGVSISGSIGSAGGGVQTGSGETGQLNTHKSGLNLDFGLFYAGYSHTKVTYSLFSHKKLITSGILYPYTSKLNVDDNGHYDLTYSSYLSHGDRFMDVHNFSTAIGKANLLPNYDNYNVTAQGLSGTIKPKFFQNINLYGRGTDSGGYGNGNYVYNGHLTSRNDYVEDSKYNIGGNKQGHFYFENSLSSFLRVNSGNTKKINNFLISDANVFNNIGTEIDETYSNEYTPEGYKKKDGSRKRDGKFVEAFTNKQIGLGHTGDGIFLEAKGIDRANDATFLEAGIGAYKITSSDGKTYHYSLPVYQLENISRSFTNKYPTAGPDEDIAFFESKQYKPYATHWLLTAVTGPDYIDINDNGQLDDEDYGYWVELEYGKWSDGYAWRTPKVGYSSLNISLFSERYSHTYSWGRKQIYYLDAIKTRTHTALFVKELRDDSESSESFAWKNKLINNNFNELNHSVPYKSKTISAFTDPRENVSFYKEDGTAVTMPTGNQQGTGIDFWYAKGTDLRYIDIPKNKLLGLKSIYLVPNKNLNAIDKTKGNIIPKLKGYTSFNTQYRLISSNSEVPGLGWYDGPLYEKQPYRVSSFDIHQHENVLDLDDIKNIDLNSISEKVIDFNYDRSSLARNTPNSSAAFSSRLALKSLGIKGKRGIKLIPDYKFNYNKTNVVYDKNKIDNWGFHIDDPSIWSLNEIANPIGSKIKIEYESDSFYTEAAYTESSIEKIDIYEYNGFYLNQYQTGQIEEYESGNNDTSIDAYEKNGDYIKLHFKEGVFVNDISLKFDIGQIVNVAYTATYRTSQEIGTNRYFQNKIVEDKYLFDSSFSNQWIRLKKFSETEHHSNFPDSNLNCYDYPIITEAYNDFPDIPYDTGCTKKISIGIYSGGYTTFENLNGKLGGGVRTQSISITDGTNNYKTNYQYTNPYNDKITGITSYYPSNEYPRKKINFASELPPPGVMYEYVTVSSENNNQYNGKTVYKFKTLTPSQNENSSFGPKFGDLLYYTKPEREDELTWTFVGLNTVARDKFTIHNNLSQIGRVESVKTYNVENQLLNCVINNYKSDLNTDGEVGVSQETFYNITKRRAYNHSTPYSNYAYHSSSVVNYPNALESTITTTAGYSNTTNFTKRDFLTGQVLETVIEDSKGEKFKTEITPAYHRPEYAGLTGNFSMGAKTDEIINKNMLTQEAMSKTYIDVNNEWKLINAGITTWNNDWRYVGMDGTINFPSGNDKKIWRKHKSFIWDGILNENNTYQNFIGTDDNFNWIPGLDEIQPNSRWKNISTTTIYDHYSMPLEVKDINDNYATTKMGDGDTKVVMTSNARYGGAFYSGAEYESEPIFLDQGIAGSRYRSLDYAHTGLYSLKIRPNDFGFLTALRDGQYDVGKYKISVWVKKSNADNARVFINEETKPFNGERINAGDWVLLNHYDELLPATEGVFITSASGTIYLDDFRMHPIASSMTSYVYNEWDELTFLMGTNGLSECYFYDEQGRLIETQSEVIDTPSRSGGFKKISENLYNYKITQ